VVSTYAARLLLLLWREATATQVVHKLINNMEKALNKQQQQLTRITHKSNNHYPLYYFFFFFSYIHMYADASSFSVLYITKAETISFLSNSL